MGEPKVNTGLFFGSFNPVHNGHLEIARFLLDDEGLDEVWFIVSPQNPLKESTNLANAQQRLEMTKLAAASEPRFKVSDVEFTMPEPSYTFDTLERLSQWHPERKFFLIIGSDNLEEFNLWKGHEQILNTYKILVYPRVKEIITRFSHHRNVVLTKAQLINISSTQIRHAVQSNSDVSRYLPEKVCAYIKVNKLYEA